jgi:hypothetical protein
METDSSENKFEVVGEIASFEVFVTKGGKEIVTMVLEVPGKWPQYVPVKLFGGLASKWQGEGKGHIVKVAGKLGGREWKGKYFGENVAMNVTMVKPKSTLKDQEPPVGGDDDIPF